MSGLLPAFELKTGSKYTDKNGDYLGEFLARREIQTYNGTVEYFSDFENKKNINTFDGEQRFRLVSSGGKKKKTRQVTMKRKNKYRRTLSKRRKMKAT
jgi:hypothetical protein